MEQHLTTRTSQITMKLQISRVSYISSYQISAF